MFDLVIIGGGNMGAALLGGLLARGAATVNPDASDGADGATAWTLETMDAPAHVAIAETFEATRELLLTRFPGLTVSAEIPPCRAAVLAVKPAGIAAAAAAAAAAGATRLLSIAAGVPTTAIEAAAGSETVAVVRAMPNTPALVGKGASAIAGGAGAGRADLTWARDILEAVGIVVEVDESQLDAVTALSGSGPAYLFLVAEALIDAGVQAGLDPALASALTTQLLVGSADLLATLGDPATLRRQVTSPGGTTAAGLAVLEERGLRDAFVTAIAAAAQRSRELANP